MSSAAQKSLELHEASPCLPRTVAFASALSREVLMCKQLISMVHTVNLWITSSVISIHDYVNQQCFSHLCYALSISKHSTSISFKVLFLFTFQLSENFVKVWLYHSGWFVIDSETFQQFVQIKEFFKISFVTYLIASCQVQKTLTLPCKRFIRAVTRALGKTHR